MAYNTWYVMSRRVTLHSHATLYINQWNSTSKKCNSYIAENRETTLVALLHWAMKGGELLNTEKIPEQKHTTYQEKNFNKKLS
jgi:hypothetical protein